MTVERLENEMSAEELDQWLEFFQEEPFGNEEKIADFRHGTLCSMIAGAIGDGKPPIDFMVYKEIKEDNHHEDWESKLLKAMTTV